MSSQKYKRSAPADTKRHDSQMTTELIYEICEKNLLAFFACLKKSTIAFCHICPSVRMCHFGCHWAVIVKFYIAGFYQFVEEFEIWIKFDMIIAKFNVSSIIHKVIICRILLLTKIIKH